jgi:transposase
MRTPPKVDEYAQMFLEEDVKEHPAATIAQRRRLLERLTEKPLSVSTVRRLLKRLGFSRKKGLWVRVKEMSGGEQLGA